MNLEVLMQGHRAGNLDLTNRDRPVFTYHSSYLALAEATPLSTSLRLDDYPKTGVHLQQWLEGVLPDDDRVLRSLHEEHDISWSNRLALLGTRIGEDCAGAVQFCPPSRTEGLINEGGCAPISDDDVLEWLRHLRNDPAYRPVSHETTGGFSLAGMQPKIALRQTSGGWAVPWGCEPTSHILKATRQEDFPHEGLMEHVTMNIASRMGIDVASTEVLVDDDPEAIVVKRYDRADDGEGGLLRVHQEDFCQALGHHPAKKYQSQGGPSPSDISALFRDLDSSDSADMLRRFRDMLIFQWLVIGTDAHSKNYSLLLQGNYVFLAPMYDTCSWLPYRETTDISKLRLSMKFGRDYRIISADRTSAVRRVAANLGLPFLETAQRCEEMAGLLPGAVGDAIEGLPAEFQNLPIISNYKTDQTQRALRCGGVAIQASREARNC